MIKKNGDTDLSELTLYGKRKERQDEENDGRLSAWTRPLDIGGHIDGQKIGTCVQGGYICIGMEQKSVAGWDRRP